jgi:preprotein translocase SecE subunit
MRKLAWASLGQDVYNSILVLLVVAVVVAAIFGLDIGLSKAASSVFD